MSTIEQDIFPVDRGWSTDHSTTAGRSTFA
jgi:hypothetical protein